MPAVVPVSFPWPISLQTPFINVITVQRQVDRVDAPLRTNSLYPLLVEEDAKNRQLIAQWFRQKSGGESAVSPEFVRAGMIFHPSRV
jgi:hypothetical protein